MYTSKTPGFCKKARIGLQHMCMPRLGGEKAGCLGRKRSREGRRRIKAFVPVLSWAIQFGQPSTNAKMQETSCKTPTQIKNPERRTHRLPTITHGSQTLTPQDSQTPSGRRRKCATTNTPGPRFRTQRVGEYSRIRHQDSKTP